MRGLPTEQSQNKKLRYR